MATPEPLYAIFDGGRSSTPPTKTSTPGHYQRVEVVGDVLMVHKAHGVVTGVLVIIQDGGEPVHIALVMAPLAGGP
jgi:hypothetical protein